MKTYVIDTNVLMKYPQILTKFGEDKVVLPSKLFQELEGLKHSEDEKTKRTAIHSINYLNNLRKKRDLSKGIKNKYGGLLISENSHEECLPPDLSISQPDNEILSVALYFKQQNEDVILMTEDGSFSLIASVATNAGIKVQSIDDFLDSTFDNFYKIKIDEEQKSENTNLIKNKKHINKRFISGVCYYIADTFHLNANAVRITLLLWLSISWMISYWLLIFTVIIYFILLFVFSNNGDIDI